MADEQRTDDLQRARREAAELLGLDVERPLCASDSLRIDLVCALRRVVDAASETVLEGGTVDLSRLVNAVETLIKLLPASKLPEPRHENDVRERLVQGYMEARARAAAAGQGYDGLVLKVKALEAELAALKGARGNESPEQAPPEPASPTPLPDNVAVLSRPGQSSAPVATPAPPQPPQTCTAEESRRRMDAVNQPIPERIRDTRPQNEPWRDFTHGGAVLHDRWRNNNW
jgi:hypothetical protein